jgi:beta-lactam-binding protein with PASTA domain/tRNA A-37 threonylcarbamoyl transferase component Bud32
VAKLHTDAGGVCLANFSSGTSEWSDIMDNIIGKKLDGRYEIQEIIGIGGMAIVYKAYDSIDDRVVAVKILKEEFLSNEDFRRRFKNESRAIAVLSHPNIVKVYDVSFGDKLQYIVMEFIDGITLKEYIDLQQVLTWKEAVHFTVQILRALEHAHEKGIVHRDIKPQNIMMLEDGTIKVTDFGIARFANSETRTITDKAIGSVHYISPEQARGAETDAKSDIYSVGVMLFEMLTGSLPFESDSAVSVAIMQLQQEPKHPREINNTIPEGLEEITLKAMQKEPIRRYATAAAMLADIDEFKRNPSIHFEYKYFVDESPTKYIDAINKTKNIEVPVTDVNKKTQKTSVIPILSGIAGALLLVALVIGFFAINSLGLWPNANDKSDIIVPTLVGLTYADIKADTKYKDIQIVQRYTQYSATVPAGKIYAQSPVIGLKVKKNSVVSVDVSLGQQMVVVPDVRNTELSAAQNALNNMLLQFDTPINEYSDTVISGFVIRTDPVNGTSVPGTTIVKIYVSQGPQIVTYSVPDLSKATKSTAQSIIEKAHFVVGTITEQNSDTVPAGALISQSPAAGSMLAANKIVSAVYSSGAAIKTTTVPVITDILHSQAVDKLTQYNLLISFDNNYVLDFSNRAKGTVVTQNLPSGKQVNAGSSVIVQESNGNSRNNYYNTETDINNVIKDYQNDNYTIAGIWDYSVIVSSNNYKEVKPNDSSYSSYLTGNYQVTGISCSDGLNIYLKVKKSST